MGVSWSVGLMRWIPHKDGTGRSFSLDHLHPFRFQFVMPAANGRLETSVMIHVGFGLHCFTRCSEPADPECDRYGDDRESRTFDRERYELSKQLRPIVEGLRQRQCAFARDDNYVTVDLGDVGGVQTRYGVFFNIKRWKERGPNAVLLVVQSAYRLDEGKQVPGRGRIKFQALVGHALRGTRPHPPP